MPTITKKQVDVEEYCLLVAVMMALIKDGYEVGIDPDFDHWNTEKLFLQGFLSKKEPREKEAFMKKATEVLDKCKDEMVDSGQQLPIKGRLPIPLGWSQELWAKTWNSADSKLRKKVERDLLEHKPDASKEEIKKAKSEYMATATVNGVRRSLAQDLWVVYHAVPTYFEEEEMELDEVNEDGEGEDEAN